MSQLSLEDLNQQVATLLALSTAGSSLELQMFSVNDITSTSEGVKLVLTEVS